MKVYENKAQLLRDLEISKLRRDISIEELKLVKSDFKDSFALPNWISPILKTVGKLGLMKLAKKAV